MSRKTLSILHDHRYEAFCLRYRHNLLRYIIENSRRQITWQQLDVIKDIQKPGSQTAIASGHGCFGIGTPMLMFDGSTRPVESLKIGDELVGDDYAPRRINNLVQGIETLYRFTYADGTSHVVNESHTLALYDHKEQQHTLMLVQRWMIDDIQLDGRYSAYRNFKSGLQLNLEIVSVECMGEGTFYGFELDGDCKFLDPDRTVLMNTGKSWLFAWLIDWHIRTYPHSTCLLTATNIIQARTGVWKYLDEVQIDILKNYPEQHGHFVKEATRYFNVHFKDSWFAFTKTAPKNAASNIAGQHGDWYMCIADEASEIADEIHGVLRGALTDERNRYVMASQPMKSVGHFAEAFTTLKDIIYKAHTLNAEESPIVSKKFIRDKLIEYGGHHSPEYQIKVLGRFPANLAGMLIPRAWFDIAMKIKLELDNWGWVLTADVAEGKFRDSSVWTIAKVCGYGSNRLVEVVEIFETLDQNEIQFANLIYNRAMELPNCTVVIDGDGAGRTTILHLESLGMQCEQIHWGLPPFSDDDKKRYRNQRAYASLKCREAIFDERMKLPNNKKMVEQGVKIPYELKEGRYVIMPKDQMRSKGIKSPDIFDTLCFLFLVDYVPVGDGVELAANNEMVQAALQLLKLNKEMIAGV